MNWSQFEGLAAIRCTAGVAIVLAAGLLLGQPAVSAFGAVGAVSVGFGSFQGAYRSRAAVMLWAAAGMALSIYVGSIAGGSHAASIATATLAAFLSGLVVALGPSASFVGLQCVVAVLIATGFPADAHGALVRGAIVFGGGLVQTLLVVMIWPLRRFTAERQTIAAVYRSLAAYAAQLPSAGATAPEPHTLAGTASPTHDPQPFARAAEVLVFQALLDEAERIRESLTALAIVSPPLPERVATSASALLAEIAEAVDIGRAPAVDDTRWQILEAAAQAHPAARGRVEALLGQLRAAFRLAATPATAPAVPARRARPVPALPPIRDGLMTLWANLSLESSVCRHGLRLAATLALATAASHAFAIPRGYWASITVLLVLKPEFGETYVRGVGRIAGTLAGAGIVVALVAMLGSHPAVVTSLLLAFVFSSYLLFRVNYAVFTLCITGYVVLLLYLAGVPGTMAAEYRALNTVIGGALALIVYRLWPTWEAGRVGDVFALLVDAFARDVALMLDAYIDPSGWNRGALDAARTAARLDRSNAEASVLRLLAEPRRERFEPQLASSLVAAFRRFAAGGLALHADLQQRPSAVPQLAELRDQLTAALAEVAATLRSGSTVVTLPPMRETFLRIREHLPPAVADALDLVIDSVETSAALAARAR